MNFLDVSKLMKYEYTADFSFPTEYGSDKLHKNSCIYLVSAYLYYNAREIYNDAITVCK